MPAHFMSFVKMAKLTVNFKLRVFIGRMVKKLRVYYTENVLFDHNWET